MSTAPNGQWNDTAAAAQEWAALAPRLAARGRVRLSPDGGRNYPRRGERRVTSRLPSQPAAVLVYDDDGCAPTLVVDLDASGPAGLAAVEADFRSLSGLLSRVGASWFSDSSPSGGRHVYVPLETPLPFAEAKALLARIATTHTTVDVLPMASITSGCIRPPGAWHRSGGHQLLEEGVTHALRALDHPTPDGVLEALEALLPPLPQAAARERPAQAEGQVEQLPALRGYAEPDNRFQQIARTGEGWQDRYASPSEARQAVLWAAVASGWSFLDVVRRLEDGTWPGLASFYAKYPHTVRRTYLLREWRRAVSHEKSRRQQPRKESVRVRPTSPHKSRGAGVGGSTVNQAVREWLAAVDLLWGPEADLALRATLYALAEAAVLKDSLTIEHGNRALAIAVGVDQRTVGRALHRLLDEPSDRLLIDLVEEAHGKRANRYRLVIPTLLQPACAAKPWRRGRIHAIRPVFRELGLPAAFVYRVLEHADAPMGGRDLAAAARIGVTATYEALQILATHGLAERVAGGWTRGGASLAQLAEAWGVLDAIRDQLARYRAERRAWWEWLDRHTAQNVIHAPFPTTPPPEPPWSPPQPVGDASSLELLERILGARVIDHHTA